MNEAAADDRRLVEAAINGDDRAFEGLVRRHQGVVRNLLRRLRHDATLADDLSQSAFLRGWQKLAEFRGGSFRSWICTIAFRLHIEHVRRFSASRELQDEGEALDPVQPSPGCELDIDQAIDALSAEQRQAILLSCAAEMSHAEIAESTGWPLGTVKSHIARAKARLRELLEAYSHD
jgi:RNA polymerase sigma-70 factor (ECF subfamily)